MEIIVIGNGVVGLAIAWELSGYFSNITVLGTTLSGAASKVAAGMLAPVGEASFEDLSDLKFNIGALNYWPDFKTKLESHSGQSIEFHMSNALLVAYTPDDKRYIQRLFDLHNALGLKTQFLTTKELRALQGYLSPYVSAGVLISSDAQVDNRKLYNALNTVLCKNNVKIIDKLVKRVVKQKNAWGIYLKDGQLLQTDVVVLATGAFLGNIEADLSLKLPKVYPVKGTTVRCRFSSKLSPSVIRGFVNSKQCYIVIRPYEIVVGATSKDAGFDTSLDLGDFADLLESSRKLLPMLDDTKIEEISTGLRPATLDHLPYIGKLDEGLLCAYGHYRNGILQTPITAKIISAILTNQEPPKESVFVDPARIKDE